MNLEKLYVGLEIKNYRELCNYLNEPQLKGNSMIRQLKEWNSYFRYRKEGYKIIIEEVYDNPMHIDDKRQSGNNSIYIKFIETILLYLLSDHEEQTLVCTKNYLLVALGITSNKYTNRLIRSKLVKNKEYQQCDIDEFDARTYSFLDGILFRALNNLKKRYLLNWNQELHISYIDETTLKQDTRVATEDEVRQYTSMKLEVLKQFRIDENKPEKYDSLRDIYLSHKTEKFYKILQEKIYDKFKWDGVFIYYRLIFSKQDIIDEIPRTERQLKNIINKNKDELNKTVVEALNSSISKHNSNILQKYEDSVNNGCFIWIDKYKLNPQYISIQQSLTNKLVKL